MSNHMNVGVCKGGEPPNFWIAKITYEFIEGRHVFTSDEIPGLLIAANDPQKAWRQIRPTIETLINKNHGVKCSVVLGKEFKEFEKKHNVMDATTGVKLSLKDTYAVISEAA